jgi:DNA-binding HxlR family transcriptional regulator
MEKSFNGSDTEMESGMADCSREKVLSREDMGTVCPVRDLLTRIGDKWTVLVIVSLAQAPGGRSRFSELKKNIDGISQRMLTTTLRHLERDGLLNRYFYPEIPPRVEYELTPVGKSVLELMQAFLDWVRTHWEEIQAARGRYDISKRIREEGNGSLRPGPSAQP